MYDLKQEGLWHVFRMALPDNNDHNPIERVSMSPYVNRCVLSQYPCPLFIFQRSYNHKWFNTLMNFTFSNDFGPRNISSSKQATMAILKVCNY